MPLSSSEALSKAIKKTNNLTPSVVPKLMNTTSVYHWQNTDSRNAVCFFFLNSTAKG